MQPLLSTSGGIVTGASGELVSPQLVAFRGLRLGLEWILSDYRGSGEKTCFVQVYTLDSHLIKIMTKRWKPRPEAVYYSEVLATFQVLLDLRRKHADVQFDLLDK
jgi:hypothetical protein